MGDMIMKIKSPPATTLINRYSLSAHRESFMTESEQEIHVILKGFKMQSIVSLDDVLAALHWVPGRHLAGLKAIIYDPDRCYDPSPGAQRVDGHSSLKAQYQGSERTIIIYCFDDSERFYHLLFHELGHYVFYHVLGSRLKKQWVTTLFRGSPSISEYGARNASEDFAESYAAYILENTRFSTLRDKYRFMHEGVFDRNLPVNVQRRLNKSI